MKIIYLGHNSFKEHKRGVENVIDFQSKAFEFDRFYYIHWGSQTIASKSKNFICISIKHCWYWPIVLNFVLLRIYKKDNTIIHSHNPLFSIFSLLKSDILTVHDAFYYLNKSKNKKITFHYKILEYLLYTRCSVVHFISNYSKEKSLFGERRNFVIIPNTSHFELSDKHIIQSSKEINLTNVLIVRSFEERSRFDLLLKVAEKLGNSNYFFKVAGKGPLYGYYQNMIKEKNINNIVLLGYVKDNELLQLYFDCDIVLMIAEYGEGFGLPVIEGYLFNKPVIASNKCAIPEVIISNDYLFENDCESIIQSLDYVSNIYNGKYHDFYQSKFSNAIVLEKFRNLYLNCNK